MVLVNGNRHDERPVVVPIAAGATAKLELIASDGRIVESTIGPADDGKLLELPASVAAPPASASATAKERVPPVPRASPEKPAKKPSGPLLADPY